MSNKYPEMRNNVAKERLCWCCGGDKARFRAEVGKAPVARIFIVTTALCLNPRWYILSDATVYVPVLAHSTMSSSEDEEERKK